MDSRRVDFQIPFGPERRRCLFFQSDISFTGISTASWSRITWTLVISTIFPPIPS